MAVQKNEHGFDLLDSRAKRFMRSAGVQPDLWILPEGVKIYLATSRPENNQYLLLGPGAGEAYPLPSTQPQPLHRLSTGPVTSINFPLVHSPSLTLSSDADFKAALGMDNHVPSAACWQ